MLPPLRRSRPGSSALAQARHVHLHEVRAPPPAAPRRRARRRALSRGHHLVRAREEDREQRPLADAADVDHPAAVHDLERAEDPELHRAFVLPLPQVLVQEPRRSANRTVAPPGRTPAAPSGGRSDGKEDENADRDRGWSRSSRGGEPARRHARGPRPRTADGTPRRRRPRRRSAGASRPTSNARATGRAVSRRS